MYGTELMPWRPFGACRLPAGTPEQVRERTTVFFPSRGADVKAAQAICSACPVVDQCAEWGLEHEHYGIWGGMSEKQRRRVRRKRGVRVVSMEILARDVCGTPYGYQRHWRLGEPVCVRCLAAAASYKQENAAENRRRRATAS